MATIEHLFHISAPRHQVYEAISSIEGLKGWWTMNTSGDSSLGGIIAFRFTNGYGVDLKVTNLKTDEDIQWAYVSGFNDWTGTTISFHLDDHDGKTRVRFKHDGWNAGVDCAGYNFTWGRFMESLRQLCQTGAGVPYGSEKHVF
jgi:uncharacterized protein YndB with AHSA1/START domain